jgi:nucleoside-diphosphate-sugar epimerase
MPSEPHRSSREGVAIVGCGYVGRALGCRLLAASDVTHVVATTRTRANVAALAELGLEPMVADLGDVSALRRAIETARVVYFTAAAKTRTDYAAVYREGLRNLLLACEDAAVGRIVYTSSTAVYAQRDGSWVDEDAEATPTTEHGRILREAESLLLGLAPAQGIAATVLRLAGIHGPGRGPQNAIARFAGSTRTDGDAYLNLVHRDVVVDALARLRTLDHQGVLNLADGRPRTRREFYDPLIAQQGLPPVRWEPNADDPIDRGRRISSRRIQELLGLDLHPV